MDTLLLAHTIVALLVTYTSFCRLSKTNHETMATVRFGIWMLGTTASASLAAPLFWGWQPDWLHVAILGCIGFLQVATSRQWKAGPPEHFQAPPVGTLSRSVR